VHVWRAPLVQSAERVEELQRLLGEDERRRAARFHFRKDRECFIVARGLLRTILGRYLHSEPRSLRFIYSVYGKPSLADSSGGLRFNLSHSGDFALLALTYGRELGVDIEKLRTDFANEQIAGRFFSPREVARLRALPAGLRLEAFFNCWTRKEAYIKAHGEGLSLPLDGFDVTLAPDEPAQLLSTRDDPGEASRWSLRALHPCHGYVAALAVEGDGWRLKTWRWPE
jgi:4'-phosphopantetheinyl transferase